MCDNLWIAAATKLHLIRTAAFFAGRTLGKKVAVNLTAAAKAEGERFRDNLWITGV